MSQDTPCGHQEVDCVQLSSSIIRCLGRSISSNWPDRTAQRKMNHPARPTKNMRQISPKIVQSIVFYLNLSEFITTVTELIAMAAAATIGFRIPAMASGIAATL